MTSTVRYSRLTACSARKVQEEGLRLQLAVSHRSVADGERPHSKQLRADTSEQSTVAKLPWKLLGAPETLEIEAVVGAEVQDEQGLAVDGATGQW